MKRETQTGTIAAKRTKLVEKVHIELKPLMKSIMYFCQAFAESAMQKCTVMDNSEIDPQHLYVETFAMGLLCVAKNLIGSSGVLAKGSDFTPIRDSLILLDTIPVPKVLQDLANFYGDFQSETFTATYYRIEDFALELIDQADALSCGNDFDINKNDSLIISIYNSSKFKCNLKTLLTDELNSLLCIPYEMPLKKSDGPYRKSIMLPKMPIEDITYQFVEDNRKILKDFPAEKFNMINYLARVEKPFECNANYSALGIFLNTDTLTDLAERIENTVGQIKDTAAYLAKIYDCSIYVPKNSGSPFQILNKQEILKHCLDRDVVNDDGRSVETDTFIALAVNDDVSKIYNHGNEKEMSVLETNLKREVLL